MNTLGPIFRELSVTTKIAGAEFRTWFERRYRCWVFTDNFCASVPVESELITVGDAELFGINCERVVMEMTHELDKCVSFSRSLLIPVGCLMDGSLLFLDASESNYMKLGSISSDQVFSTASGLVSPDWFGPYPLTYEEWLIFRFRNVGSYAYY